jgi:hypothetical protein
MTTNELHAAIINLPSNEAARPIILSRPDECHAYRIGHRDARHAAAELVAVNHENVNAELLEACTDLMRIVVAQFGNGHADVNAVLDRANAAIHKATS